MAQLPPSFPPPEPRSPSSPSPAGLAPSPRPRPSPAAAGAQPSHRPPPPHRSPPPSRPGLRLAVALLTVSLFGCDHATKIAAEASLSHGRAVELVSGVLELRYAANDDTAFSLLRTFGVARTPSVLLAVASVALLAVASMWFAQRKRASGAQHVGFALVLAGALGNVVDRAARGYVVDFIHVTRWPVFNVADIAVVAGAILLGLAAWRPRRGADRDHAPEAPS
jgi:signal peptidase II